MYKEYNKKISDVLFDIERIQSNSVINKAYDLIYKYCDNIDDVETDMGYDFTNAVWGIEEKEIIEELENLRAA